MNVCFYVLNLRVNYAYFSHLCHVEVMVINNFITINASYCIIKLKLFYLHCVQRENVRKA